MFPFMPNHLHQLKLYRRSIRASFFLVIFLVLIGGVVRSTGAGMGCPDWPKCFGLWVPPTDISQVPLSYYSNALALRDGKLVFNVYRTWTEYLNRLLGVFIGFSIFIQMVLSFTSSPGFTSRLYSAAAFVMVAFQGWLGSKVVSTDLKPLVITIHLIVALLIALALLAALHFAQVLKSDVQSIQKKSVVYVCLLLLTVQFFLGTEVRSQIDVLFKAFNYELRNLYLDNLDWMFYIHRSLSVVVVFLVSYQIYALGRQIDIARFGILLWPLFSSIALVFTGIVLVYFDFPALVQPFHLFFGFVIFCCQFWLLLKVSSMSRLSYAVN